MFGLAALAVLAACSTPVGYHAPVEDRGADPALASKVDPATLPGAENAGKPGYYTVQRGDTVWRIATRHGQPWRNIVRWNELPNADVIEVGQVLRVVPPEGAAVATQTTAGAARASAPAAASSTQFIWPAKGQVISSFSADSKGIGIAGNAGDPVEAAAAGKVVYAGSGLRGYGNLVIVQHDDTYITAYAHNQKILVHEDENVRKGQKIAEMGSSDADRTKLHFEVRQQGKPVDPLKYLPAR